MTHSPRDAHKKNQNDASRSVIWMPNHLGDAVMALPAWESLCRERAAVHLPEPVVVARSAVAALMKLCARPDTRIMETPSGFGGLIKTAGDLRALGHCSGVVLAESFRSALTLRLGGVGPLAGKITDHRGPLLTRTQALSPQATAHLHRSQEYARLLGVACASDALEAVRGRIAKTLTDRFQGLQESRRGPDGKDRGANRTLQLALFPGAARGPSKVWPLESFCAAIKILAGHTQLECTVLGTAADHAMGESVRAALSLPVRNLCGQTPLPQLLAELGRCDLVLANDSGGAHLAALVGTAVVVVFGATSPARTAPLGQRVAVVTAPGQHSERISRSSRSASEQLSLVSPEQVAAAARQLCSLGTGV